MRRRTSDGPPARTDAFSPGQDGDGARYGRAYLVVGKRVRRHSESGDTLIEILISLVIIALAVVALLAALTTSITSSTEHREIAVNDTMLKSLANQATYSIEFNTSSPGVFQACAAPSHYSNTNIGWTDPSQYPGYHASITQVVYWNPSTNKFDSSVSQATCNGYSATQKGIQELVIVSTANNGNGPSLALTAIVRDPNFE